MARLSTRISIRWPPSPPTEPTDTLVMGVGEYYMDLRVRKSDSTIDWAMAGKRIVLSQDPMTVRFTHTIDSRGYTAPDTGKFTPLPNGDDLEVGAMPDPSRDGEVHPYEEIWREIPPPSTSSTAWIISTASAASGTTFLGRLGDAFLAFHQGPDGLFSARREERGDGGGWEVKYLLGKEVKEDLPGVGEVGWEFGVPLGSTGAEVELLGRRWVVCGVQETG